MDFFFLKWSIGEKKRTQQYDGSERKYTASICFRLVREFKSSGVQKFNKVHPVLNKIINWLCNVVSTTTINTLVYETFQSCSYDNPMTVIWHSCDISLLRHSHGGLVTVLLTYSSMIWWSRDNVKVVSNQRIVRTALLYNINLEFQCL